ncbi:hypothetical protein Ae406Ps2_5436c [Pseudonocardia sp. Ae406_Ps2]|uniref:hypothetical protein n=1 Tax=unclassified Pseudonocardia TaxID=2619320 RepID=UPI00094AAB8A|nr:MULTISPECIES: hypothetical protein [unclassified Pseudonocardia]OLL96853.1 hypothetical protein Ae331Ps2_0520 [Pseudonocardia sp. Ae331_Ps2]OLM05436.1 hypothetical protein Ae406Ps2_5436c [Pseudonocardia sp. Ae406_Ps2]OLM15616.1 hypothetical protein Ae505Ps2_5748 [Pseudonocardia sp. Ae505_Ps2]OLM32878.1 hypothetical protein Ae717Ps2_3774 [Pseudonocardia sp. Ae717_Ps2]
MDDDRGLRILGWAGPLSILLVLVGWLSAGFFPPPPPSLAGEELLRFWGTDTTLKQLSMVICVWGGVLYAPASLAVFVALRRSGDLALNLGQACIGVLGTVFFSLNFVLLSLVPYRLENGDSGYSQLLHDVGFTMTFMPVAPFTVQYLLIAAIILRDRSGRLPYPRWVAYVNIWVALLLVPATFIPLFHSGPLAWNGMFSFWVPVAVFVGWFVVMFPPLVAGRRSTAPAPSATPPSATAPS